jgi:adenine-specific DNA-methyltransferase
MRSGVRERPAVPQALRLLVSTARARRFRSTGPLLAKVEILRLDACRRVDPDRRAELGQFLTPPDLAGLMARMFGPFPERVRILDAGAGVGTLFAAVVAESCARDGRPTAVDAVAHEIDPTLGGYLRAAMAMCRCEASIHGIAFDGEIVLGDFIQRSVDDLARFPGGCFTHAILNPPYKKLAVRSEARLAARSAGIEASNLYTAFVGLSIKLLAPGAELVAIVPRSFCNGPYFRPFRDLLFATMSIRRIHVFESRSLAFSDNRVLQENVIIHAVKGKQRPTVIVSSSAGPDCHDGAARIVPFDRIVRPEDPDRFLRIAHDAFGPRAADPFSRFTCSLADLGLRVSTGRVVAYRVKDFLRGDPDEKTGPLIHSAHVSNGAVAWPKSGKKPNALVDCHETAGLWMPSAAYVIVKRLSSKEERRRIAAGVFDPALVAAPRIAFENHLNVVHANGGMDLDLARGLVAFLRSTVVDTHFRQLSGHTQVNATDLRNMKYPSAAALRDLGTRVGATHPSQEDLDRLVDAL